MSESSRPSREEIVARFDRLFAKYSPCDTNETRSLITRIGAASRAEAMAAAERLVAIGELFAARIREFGETEDWAVDTTEVVASEVAAELRISQGMAISYLRYARAMRERLPLSGAVFRAGDIGFRLFQTLVYRTDLITDRDELAAVDAELALAAPRWPSMTQGRLAAQVDKIVWRADRDAVRRRREAIRDREVWISDRLDGLSDIQGTLLTPYAHALGKRLAGMAATVCDADPRTAEQRHSDALGALAGGADRLDCQFRTRSKPTWCDDHIAEIQRQGGIRPLEGFTHPNDWRLTECLNCTVWAHYRFNYTLEKNSYGELTCRACYWRGWAGHARALQGVWASVEPVPYEQAKSFSEEHGFDYLGPLTAPSLPDDPHHTRCRRCGKISAERLGDIAFAALAVEANR